MEIDYGALYGVEVKGGKEQEITEPAAEQGAQGEKEQAITEPAVEEPADHGGAEPDEEGTEESGSETKSPQSKQERAVYAARRRQQEKEEAARLDHEKAMAEADEYLNFAIRALGLTDPYTGKPITTKAEMDAYRASHGNAERKRVMEKAGMTQEAFDQFVSTIPEVAAAKAALAQADAERKRRWTRSSVRPSAKSWTKSKN